MGSMIMNQLGEKLDKMFREDTCFTCHGRNGNWIIELQEALEELAINVEKFAENSNGYFIVKDGRLRLKDRTQCVNKRAIRDIVEMCI